MIKTLLILILLAALVGAAVFTRPSEADFKEYLKQNPPGDDKNFFEKLFTGSSTDFTYNNYFLWADVKKDGKTVYIGALSHWFDRREPLAKPVETHQ